jgi:hypothetical protein
LGRASESLTASFSNEHPPQFKSENSKFKIPPAFLRPSRRASSPFGLAEGPRFNDASRQPHVQPKTQNSELKTVSRPPPSLKKRRRRRTICFVRLRPPAPATYIKYASALRARLSRIWPNGAGTVALRAARRCHTTLPVATLRHSGVCFAKGGLPGILECGGLPPLLPQRLAAGLLIQCTAASRAR